MLADVLEYLRCPACHAELAVGEQAVGCRAGHRFDIARQGYVSLLSGRPRAGSGDAAAMVAARHRFLGAGHFTWLADVLAGMGARALADGPAGCVVDVGAGTGFYLAMVLDALPDRRGLALDVSRYALRRAARAHPRAGAVGCDIWDALPVRTGAAALLLNVFAPRNGAELARILHPGGALLVVTPTPRHLAEAAPVLGPVQVDERKQDRLERGLGGHLVRTAGAVHERTLRLARADLLALGQMGPGSRHQDDAALEDRVAGLPDPVAVTASVVLSTYRHATSL